MNKQQEALKLALEALVKTDAEPGSKAWEREAEAITAIRSVLNEHGEALAEQPAQQPVAMRYDFDGYGYKYIDAGSGSDWQTRIKDAEPVYASPQPAQQEPFGYFRYDLRLDAWVQNRAGLTGTPFYTSPPNVPPARASQSRSDVKPWVGLSTDEIYDMYNEPRSDAEMVEFARAIEAKLREKNYG